jgi:hypothetical protein
MSRSEHPLRWFEAREHLLSTVLVVLTLGTLHELRLGPVLRYGLPRSHDAMNIVIAGVIGG